MSSSSYALALHPLFLSLSDSDSPVSGFPQYTWRQERVRWSPLIAAATRTRSRRDLKLSSVPVSLVKLRAPPGPCLPVLMVRTLQLAVHGFPVGTTGLRNGSLASACSSGTLADKVVRCLGLSADSFLPQMTIWPNVTLISCCQRHFSVLLNYLSPHNNVWL